VGEVRSSPIKGTRARLTSEADDRAAALELESDAKERAENLMIVDLMRNDLGRVSLADSVAVTKLFSVESHATVHQLVSSVEAKLQAGVELQDVIAAVFPAGSMTGAPKIRAMQLIAQMERTPRGTYSGAAGYFGLDGTVDLGMVIRSLIFEADEVSIGVGGGITIDSDPAAEFAEIRLKARALLDVLGVQDPWASA
jgi:anthranilate/para-aminobenzoate synthase component I